jgi:hypothetical protein
VLLQAGSIPYAAAVAGGEEAVKTANIAVGEKNAAVSVEVTAVVVLTPCCCAELDSFRFDLNKYDNKSNSREKSTC